MFAVLRVALCMTVGVFVCVSLVTTETGVVVKSVKRLVYIIVVILD